MKKSVLTAQGLCVDRGGRRVLNEVSFRVGQGEVFALLGGNGAGKSTTLLTFLGFIRPSGGRVSINGIVVHENKAAIRQQTAYRPESASLYAHLSAREQWRYWRRSRLGMIAGLALLMLVLASIISTTLHVETERTKVRLGIRAKTCHFSPGLTRIAFEGLCSGGQRPILLVVDLFLEVHAAIYVDIKGV